MVEGEGFEPSKAEPADLQSDPFDRSGTPPLSCPSPDQLFSLRCRENGVHYIETFLNCKLFFKKFKFILPRTP